MLQKATKADIAQYGDLAYSLALNRSACCYPTYSGKTKEDFLADAIKAATSPDWELLLYLEGGQVLGWFSYFWLPDDGYLQLHHCCLSKGAAQGLSELLVSLRGRFSGYTLYFGFPGENRQALLQLQKEGFSLIEQSWDTSLPLSPQPLAPMPPDVRLLTPEYIRDFEAVYHPDDSTYWNCRRICDNLSQWTVFLSYESSQPTGAVFFTGDEMQQEIFGLCLNEDHFSTEAAEKLLTAAIVHCQRRSVSLLRFFCEKEQLATLQKLGFCCLGQYLLYTLTI